MCYEWENVEAARSSIMLQADQPERRAIPRHRVILPAMCWSARRRDFYAVTHDISAHGICFRSSVVPNVDEDLTCSIRHVGHVEGTVARASAETFVFRVRAQAQSAGKIAKSLLALSRQQEQPEEPSRLYRRVIPLQTQVDVQLPCGRFMPGKLLNVSATGAALFIDEPVELGALLRIGGTWAKVARQFESGVGAAFLAPLDPQDVSEEVRL